ncbi:MAG TPA: hypothetical protein VFM89_04345, partial [Casimicrobiaceae bacterium]|nr:hypothetical protein [Casimicrobiaceae bacterium]
MAFQRSASGCSGEIRPQSNSIAAANVEIERRNRASRTIISATTRFAEQASSNGDTCSRYIVDTLRFAKFSVEFMRGAMHESCSAEGDPREKRQTARR